MGVIEFEGWRVKLKNIDTLNHSKEVSKIGLVFEQIGDCTFANAIGDVSNYYGIIGEVLSQISSGSFSTIIETESGDKLKILLSSDYVIENDKDISSFFGF